MTNYNNQETPVFICHFFCNRFKMSEREREREREVVQEGVQSPLTSSWLIHTQKVISSVTVFLTACHPWHFIWRYPHSLNSKILSPQRKFGFYLFGLTCCFFFFSCLKFNFSLCLTIF